MEKNNFNEEESQQNDNQQQGEDEEDSNVTSSIENVIPIKKISHGWKVLQGFAKKSCVVAMEKVEEINHSQTMESVKSTTSSAWNKTIEVATPAATNLWENTKVVASQVSEKSQEVAIKTKDVAIKLGEDLKPVTEKVAEQVTVGAKKSWEVVSETAKTTADIVVDVSKKAAQDISHVISEKTGSNGNDDGISDQNNQI